MIDIENNIKPCPFCGSEAKLIKREEEHYSTGKDIISYDVVCCNNENHSLDYYADTPEEIINIWNERPTEKTIDKKSDFYKNCCRRRKENAKICNSCPFRESIEKVENNE